MNNYKLIIQYDGTDYAGWQIQKNNPTIQQKISDSIQIILKEKITLHGSGRTDSGVHALGQTANFKTNSNIDIYRFRYSLNSLLPFDISVISMEKTNEDFNARFDAKKRSYLYIFSKIKSPFFHRYSFFYHNDLKVKKLNEISRIFLGQNDFTSFCRKRTETENKICNIYNIHWKETKELILFFIEADRFLHGMVRSITGTLLQAQQEENSINFIENIFNEKNRETAGESVPAKGLFLYKVKY